MSVSKKRYWIKRILSGSQDQGENEFRFQEGEEPRQGLEETSTAALGITFLGAAFTLTPLPYSSWDRPGTWGSLLQCCKGCTWTYLSLSYKIQRNYMRIKKNYVQMQLGKFRTKKYKKTKNPTALSEESGEKKDGYLGAKEGLHMPTAPNTTKVVGKPPKWPLQPGHWIHSYPHSI